MEEIFFYGSIPSSLSSLRGLKYFDISQNNLSGQIPEYLGSFDLQFLNLSFNDFQGVLPEEGIFKNADKISVIGNPKLCGDTPKLKIPRCTTKQSKKFFATLTFTLTVSMVSELLGLSLLIGLVFLYWSQTNEVHFGDSSRASFFKVSYHSLYRATDGFSSANLVGVGSFSSVYKGILECTGTVVAVKVFNLLQHGASKSFMVEYKALRNVKHRNLVKVLLFR
ncbi:putative LRR receptor-like serine/threonine-protein kinase [Abeliophyllum distichum]|uniref:LRR receptor-like serine/threonine-protein kinase n=1 Tax=Abeliophyllum distichum TaxID=126358 RepID=A0ABD1UMX3_9LAMI